MESETQSEQTNILRAFITGYTPLRLTPQSLSKSLTRRYPFIKTVKFPNNNKPWQGYAFVDFEEKPDFLTFIKEKRIRLEEFSMNLVIKPHKQGKALKRRLKDIKKEIEGLKNSFKLG